MSVSSFLVSHPALVDGTLPALYATRDTCKFFFSEMRSTISALLDPEVSEPYRASPNFFGSRDLFAVAVWRERRQYAGQKKAEGLN